jgi:hypothetical protein
MTPLLVAIAIVLLTKLFHSMAIELTSGNAGTPRSGRELILRSILLLLGPKIVLIAGIFFTCVSVGWLAVRLLQPPKMVFLKPDKAPRIIR